MLVTFSSLDSYSKSNKCLLSPAPGVNPAYIWPLSTIRNGQVPTNPPLKTHGNIVVDGDGLVLEDESAYLNAGDFQGMYGSDFYENQKASLSFLLSFLKTIY